MKLLFLRLFACATYCALLSCGTYPISATGSRLDLPKDSLLLFQDTFLVNKHPNPHRIKGHLLPESKIKSVRYQDAFTAFNIGLVDLDGNGNFSEKGTDWIILTTRQNQQIRINGEHGTPHCIISDSLYLGIDDWVYLLHGINADGRQAKLRKVSPRSQFKGKIALGLKITCNNVVFKRYAGHDLSIDSIKALRKYTYIYFWNTRKLEYQMDIVQSLYNTNNQVTIVGVHCKDHELDPETSGNFFELISKPWNGAFCTSAQYNALNQDYSWYRGLLIRDNGEIIFPHISPKELETWLTEQ